MQNNQKYYEYRVKISNWKCNRVTNKELSMDIDARPCNVASEGTFFQNTFR